MHHSPDYSDIVQNTWCMTTTATFSALLRTPNDVIAQLDGGDVLLTRRDAEPLRLSKARRVEREASTLSALSQLIAASLDDDRSDVIASHLPDPFPWIEFLPDEDRRAFVGEFFRTARACAAVDNFDRLGVALAAWEGTAQAYAAGLDPHGADLDYLDDSDPVGDPRTDT